MSTVEDAEPRLGADLWLAHFHVHRRAPQDSVAWAKSPAVSSARAHGARSTMPTRNAQRLRLCPPTRFIGVSLRRDIGRKRIVDQYLAPQRCRQSRRHGVVAVELPVREIRRIEQYIIGTQMIDHPFDHDRGRPARRTARWSAAHGRARYRPASGRPRAPPSARRARTSTTATGSPAARSRPDSSSTTLSPGNLAKTPSQIRLPSCDWNAWA